MDLCGNCEEKQKWLLENDDGSQVVCTCADRFSEEGVEECSRDDDGESKETNHSDVAVQTPKRTSTSIMAVDAPQRKIQKIDRKLWMNPGRDIRRNLFKDYDLETLKRVQYKRWAILKIENITTSPFHRCI